MKGKGRTMIVQRSTRYRGLCLAIGAVTVAALLAGCSSSKNGGSGSSGGSGKTLVIGAPFPLTGIWAQNGQNNVHGMEVAADEINAAGGIQALGGAKIKIVSADTSSDNPAQALTVTSKLIQDSNAVAIVGCYLSSMSLTASTAAEKAKIPFLTQSFVSTLTSRGYKYLFQVAPKADSFGKTTIADMQAVFKTTNQQLNSAAVVTANDAAGQQQNAAVVAAAEAAGLKISANVSYPVGIADASPIVSKLSAAKPDAIITEGSLADVSQIIKGTRAAGVKAPFVNPGGGGALTEQFTQSLGDLANGVLSASAWNADLKLPGVAAANTAYMQKFSAKYMPQEAGESWVAVHAIAAAMESAKSSDPSKVRDALASADYTSGPESSMPPGKVGFTDTGAPKYAAPVLVQWQNGALKTVYPDSLASVKVIGLG
jgi:branched-chain amino acid transport system substrate-binding protein